MASIQPCKTSVTILHELCKKKRLSIKYAEEEANHVAVEEQSPASVDVKLSSPQQSDDLESSEVLSLSSARGQLEVEELQLKEQLKQLQLDEQQLDSWLQNQSSVKKGGRLRQLRVYEVKVTVGDVTAKGQGSSKKKAKEAAAAAALQQLNSGSFEQQSMQEPANGLANQAVSESPTERLAGATQTAAETVPPSVGTSDNPIGTLNQLLHNLFLPPVRYEYECSTMKQGLSYQRQFTCTANVYNLSMNGIGSTKMKSKKQAATQLLQLLQEVVAKDRAEKEKSLRDDENDDGHDVKTESATDVLRHHQLLDPLSAESVEKMEKFFVALRSRTGKTLASLEHMQLNRPHTNYCQMLCEISEEQGINVSYTQLVEATSAGEFQCLVQIHSSPVIVCHGVGRTSDEARALAAHNALQYLRIMTRKS